MDNLLQTCTVGLTHLSTAASEQPAGVSASSPPATQPPSPPISRRERKARARAERAARRVPYREDNKLAGEWCLVKKPPKRHPDRRHKGPPAVSFTDYDTAPSGSASEVDEAAYYAQRTAHSRTPRKRHTRHKETKRRFDSTLGYPGEGPCNKRCCADRRHAHRRRDMPRPPPGDGKAGAGARKRIQDKKHLQAYAWCHRGAAGEKCPAVSAAAEHYSCDLSTNVQAERAITGPSNHDPIYDDHVILPQRGREAKVPDRAEIDMVPAPYNAEPNVRVRSPAPTDLEDALPDDVDDPVLQALNEFDAERADSGGDGKGAPVHDRDSQHSDSSSEDSAASDDDQPVRWHDPQRTPSPPPPRVPHHPHNPPRTGTPPSAVNGAHAPVPRSREFDEDFSTEDCIRPDRLALVPIGGYYPSAWKGPREDAFHGYATPGDTKVKSQAPLRAHDLGLRAMASAANHSAGTRCGHISVRYIYTSHPIRCLVTFPPPDEFQVHDRVVLSVPLHVAAMCRDGKTLSLQDILVLTRMRPAQYGMERAPTGTATRHWCGRMYEYLTRSRGTVLGRADGTPTDFNVLRALGYTSYTKLMVSDSLIRDVLNDPAFHAITAFTSAGAKIDVHPRVIPLVRKYMQAYALGDRAATVVSSTCVYLCQLLWCAQAYRLLTAPAGTAPAVAVFQ